MRQKWKIKILKIRVIVRTPFISIYSVYISIPVCLSPPLSPCTILRHVTMEEDHVRGLVQVALGFRFLGRVCDAVRTPSSNEFQPDRKILYSQAGGRMEGGRGYIVGITRW